MFLWESHMIHVLYATKVNVGGWATFTRHLVASLGHEAQLWRIGNKTESGTRPFAGSDEFRYRNVAVDHMPHLFKGDPVIIAALGKHYVDAVAPLIKAGAG